MGIQTPHSPQEKKFRERIRQLKKISKNGIFGQIAILADFLAKLGFEAFRFEKFSVLGIFQHTPDYTTSQKKSKLHIFISMKYEHWKINCGFRGNWIHVNFKFAFSSPICYYGLASSPFYFSFHDFLCSIQMRPCISACFKRFKKTFIDILKLIQTIFHST